MKTTNYLILLLTLVSITLIPLKSDTKLIFAKAHYVTSSILNAIPKRSMHRTKTLSSLQITAPSNGHIVIESSGTGCIHTQREFIEILLSDNHKRTLSSNTFAWLGKGKACAIGEIKTYSFRHIEAVKAGKTYKYQILAQRGSRKKVSGNIYIGALTATFYSSQNRHKPLVKKEVLKDGTVKLIYPNGKIVEKSNSGTKITLPDGQVRINTYIQAPFSNLPEEPNTASEKTWLNKHAEQLLSIIKREIDDYLTMQKYLNMEKEEKLSIFKIIDKRSTIIERLLND